MNITSSAAINPYDILGVSQAASKAEIASAFAAAMKSRKYPVEAIAKAQKSLMKPRERLQADYLRPILPIIKRFKREDLSALETPAPILTFLAEFDGLDSAINEAFQQELLEKETLDISIELYQKALESYHQKQYQEAVELFEEFCQTGDRSSPEFIQAQMWLVKAYQASNKLPQAIALCEQMNASDRPQIKNWAEKALKSLMSATVKLPQLNQKPAPSLSEIVEIFKQGRYQEAIKFLEKFGTYTDKQAKEYVQAQMWLVKAYQANQELDKALELCQQMNANDNLQIKNWATKALESLTLAAPKPQPVNLPTAIGIFKEKRYQEAVKLLEEFCLNSANNSGELIQGQMWLVKAYQANGNLEKAIALCEQLTKTEHHQVQNWSAQAWRSLIAQQRS